MSLSSGINAHEGKEPEERCNDIIISLSHTSSGNFLPPSTTQEVLLDVNTFYFLCSFVPGARAQAPAAL